MSPSTVSFCSSAIAISTPTNSKSANSAADVDAGWQTNLSRFEPWLCWPLGVVSSSGSTSSFCSSEHSIVKTSRYGPPWSSVPSPANFTLNARSRR